MMRRLLLPAVLVVTALGLAGCASEASSRMHGGAASRQDGQWTVTALAPDGSAQDNLGYFSRVIALIWQTTDQQSGSAYVDALVAAGFDRSAMQLTSDVSTVDNPAESFQISVHWHADCLIGQIGPSIGEPHAVVVPAIGQGTCLVGRTIPLD